MKSAASKRVRSEIAPAPLRSNPSPELVMTGMIETLIRERAYQLYVERNGQNGDAESDWYTAEAEMLQRMNNAAA
jgi:hypothetical protein